MIFNLFRKPAVAPDAVHEAYVSIVAQSRQPRFFADWGVPDTVTGRFDMISLHLALYLRRLKNEPSARQFTQALIELFFKDMDRSLREMGAGDLGVPKKIQKMGNIFFGLLAALNEAMDRNDEEALAAVISRNVFDGTDSPNVRALVAYVIEHDAVLAAQSMETIIAGDVRFEAAA